MTEERELTRKELQEQLAAANAKLAEKPDVAALVAAEVAKALQQQGDARSAALQRQLDEANAELAKRSVSGPAPVGAAPKYVPYKGYVQATEDCHSGGFYRKGPKEGDPGDIFDVDVPVLWSDDPYKPVLLKFTDLGVRFAVDHPDPPPRIDFRFRPRVSVSTDLEPLRAGSF